MSGDSYATRCPRRLESFIGRRRRACDLGFGYRSPQSGEWIKATCGAIAGRRNERFWMTMRAGGRLAWVN